MSANPNLLALLNAINTNTLTVGMQGALAQALALIIPNFPTPDEMSSALPPPDEDDAREWIAALYSIQATGGGGGGSVVNAAFTPNTEQTFGPVTPTGLGIDLAVADITPTGSGLLQITATVAVISSVPDAVNLALFAVAPLTAITGGSLVGQGITLDPTSTTPATSGIPIMSTEGNDGTVNPDTVGVTITATYQAVVGQRTGIVLQGSSAVGGATTWTVALTMSVVELASGGAGGGVASVAVAGNSGLVVTNPTTTPVIGPLPGFAPATLEFATIASMGAFNVGAPTALVQGQRAFVLSNGSIWTLQSSALAVDGITIVNATGVAGTQWVRVNEAGYLPAALEQPSWFIDPQNVSGTASDENSGATNVLALRTKAEVFRRWGYTWSPTLVGPLNVTITYLSPDLSGSSDPGLFAPIFVNGSTLVQTAALPAASFTGTLLAVTPKNKASAATGTPLRATFTTTTGAVAGNMLLVNTTRGNSRAFAQRNTGGGLWQITQPYTPQTGIGFYAATEVDTWANGDTILGYALLNVDLALIGGITSVIQAGFAGPSHIVQQVNIFDPTGLNFDPCILDCAAMLQVQECSFNRSKGSRNNNAVGSSINNCITNPSGFILGTAFGLSIVGGCLQGLVSNQYAAPILGGDVIVGSGGANTYTFFNATIADVAIDAGSTMALVGQTVVNGIVYGVHGTLGTLSARGNIQYGGPALTKLMATLTVGNATSAYSNLTTAGLTATHLVALNPTNLDAAAGAAGFGGLAYVPGVGGFYNAAVTPP